MPATSQAQQRFFGMVEAGKVKRPSRMTGEQVKEFASTPRRGLPQRAGNVARESAKRLAASKMSRKKSGEKRGLSGRMGIAGGARGAMGGMVTSALLGLFLLFAQPVHATTYYVDAANGHDGNAGTSGAPFATIGKANGSMSAGDVCLIRPGTYFDTPGQADTLEASGIRYYYGNIARPQDVILAGSVPINRSHLSIAGVTFQNQLKLQGDLDATWNASGILPRSLYGGGALRDTIRDFICGSGGSGSTGSLFMNSYYCVILRGTCYGSNFWMAREGPSAVGNVVQEVNFPNLGQGNNPVAGNDDINSGGGTHQSCRADSNQVRFCNFTILAQNLPQGAGNPRACYLTTHCLWYENHYYVTTLGTATQNFLIWERDSSRFNTYRCDTAIVTGAGSIQFQLPATGHIVGSCSDATVDSCLFLCKNTGYTTFAPNGNGSERLTNFTMRYTTIAMAAPGAAAFQAQDIKGKTKIHHNTFVADGLHGSTQYPGYGGVVVLGGETYPAWDDTVWFSSNILYSTASPTGLGYALNPYGLCTYCGSGCEKPAPCFQFAVRYDESKADSVNEAAGGGSVSRKHIINYNLYSCYSDSASVGDRSIYFFGNGNVHCTTPGSTTTPGAGANYWFRYAKYDSASVYGSPLFGTGRAADSTVAGLNPVLQTGSAAIGKGQWGTDIGAVAFTNYSGIAVAPSQVHWVAGLAGHHDIAITNPGTATLNISSNGFSSLSSFSCSPAMPTTVAAGVTKVITITYDGSVPHDHDDGTGKFVWSFNIVSDAKNAPTTVVILYGDPNYTNTISP